MTLYCEQPRYGAAPDPEPLPDREPAPAHSPLPDQEPQPDDELTPPHPEQLLAPLAGPRAAADDSLRLPPLQGERFLPPPRPEDRLECLVSTPDLRRLDLQAALTAAGVAPVTGDSAAVHRIAHLDESTVTAVISWIAAAARRPRTY